MEQCGLLDTLGLGPERRLRFERLLYAVKYVRPPPSLPPSPTSQPTTHRTVSYAHLPYPPRTFKTTTLCAPRVLGRTRRAPNAITLRAHQGGSIHTHWPHDRDK